MRKRIGGVLWLLCALFTLFLVSCGGGSGGGATSSNTTSPQKIDAMTAVMESGGSYYKSIVNSGITSEEAATQTIAWLKKQGGILDATYDQDKDKIIVKDTTGITTVIVTNNNYISNPPVVTNKLSLSTTLSKSNNLSQATVKALIIKPSFILAQNASRVYDTLKSNGSEVTYLKDDSVTVQSLEELKNYDIIYYFGHGAISNTKTVKDNRDVTALAIMTGETFSADKVQIYTKTITDLGLPLDYKDDGSNQYLYRFVVPNILGGDSSKSTIGVTSLYLKAIAKDLKASVIYIDACHSLESEAMADAFISNGAKTYFGWNKSVNPTYTYVYPQSIISDLFAGQDADSAYNKLSFDSSKAILLARGEGKTKLPPFNVTSTLTYSVSGKVTSNGIGLQGATVTLSGSGSSSVITDSNGAYTFTNASNGTYSITAVKAGYNLTPFSISNLTVNGANVVNQNFTANVTLVTYSMSGIIHSVSNSGPALSGATVSIAGKTATTTSTGTFSITGIPTGTYVFSVFKSGYDTYTNPAYYVASNKTDLSFYLSQPTTTYSISGTIHAFSNTGNVLSNATVSIAGKTTTTSSTGTFSISGIPAGTYAFSVSRFGWDSYTNPAYAVGSNQVGLNFYLNASAPFGALAINSSTMSAGLSGGYATIDLANSRALQECGVGCSIVLDYSYGTCAAYAKGSASYGYAVAETLIQATSTALSYCSQYSAGCSVVLSRCNY